MILELMMILKLMMILELMMILKLILCSELTWIVLIFIFSFIALLYYRKKKRG